MSFLERFSDEQRRLFEGAATPLLFPRGHYLVRRGEPGGDVYLLKKGQFEVVDTRNTPEVILAVFDEGTIIGEMAFIDDSPRSADVRAATDGEVLVWTREDLRNLLEREPKLGATFYESVARLTGARVRSMTTTAMSGGLTREQQPRNAAGITRVKDEARLLAEQIKDTLIDIDTKLRQDASDVVTQHKVRLCLDKLQEDMRQLFAAHPEPEAAHAASKVLSRELHPYLVRSSLAERCIRRSEGVGGAADILAHVLVDSAGGDGQLGELIDRWLLDRPMLRAMRHFREPTLEAVRNHLPKHRNRRVLVVNAGTGSLIASLSHVVAKAPTVVTVLDQSKEALAYLDAGISRPKSVDFRTLQESLPGFAMGRTRVTLPHEQDVIVLQAMMEYMPERIAVALLTMCRQLLAPGGLVIAPALGPSDDQDLFDWLLNWPTVRRTKEGMRRIFAGAGYPTVVEQEMHAPALLFTGQIPDKAGEPPTARGAPGRQTMGRQTSEL